MEGVIYKITSPTGKCYIGKTVNFKKRMADYKALRCKGQPKLYRSLLKHGFENHIIEKLFAGANCHCFLYSLERSFVRLFDSVNTGLNSCAGGIGVSGLSEESRKKLSLAIKINNAMWSETHKEKMRASCRTDEYREAARQRALGNYNGKRIKVRQLDINGKPIAEFDSAMHAERAVAGTLGTKITACCKGKRRTHGGYRWEYA